MEELKNKIDQLIGSYEIELLVSKGAAEIAVSLPVQSALNTRVLVLEKVLVELRHLSALCMLTA